MREQQKTEHQTPDAEKVTPAQKWIWAIGGLTENFIGTGILYLGMSIYNLGLGLKATLIGVVLAAPRIIDAVVDPLIGNLSDNTRTRWGRRRPFILIGGLIAALFYFLSWCPPTGWSDTAVFAYFLVTTMLCFLGYAIFTIPYNALGLEMTTDYHERTRVQSAKYLFLIVAQLLSSWLYWACFRFGELAGPREGMKTEVVGVRYVAFIVAIVVIASSVLPAIFCRERAIATSSHQKINFLRAITQTLSHKSFLILCALFLATNIGLNLVAPIGTYVSIFHACDGNKEFGATVSAYGGTLHGVLGFIAAWPVNWLARKQGKRFAMMCGLGFAMLGSLSTWFCYTPVQPWLQLIPWSIMCTGLTCLWILTPSMMADICDLDELQCGVKRAGMFGAVFALVLKGGASLAAGFSGLMVEWVGIDTEVTVQSPKTILLMRVLFAVVPAALMGVSLLLTWIFPVTEEEVHKVRAIIDARQKDESTEPETQPEPVTSN